MCVGGPKAAIRSAGFSGAPRTLWSGGFWTRDRHHQTGYTISAKSPWCPAERSCLGHGIYDCNGLYEDCHDEELIWNPRFDTCYEYLRDRGVHALGPPDWDRFDCTMCMPMCPVVPPKVSYGLEVHYWGDWESDQQSWTSVVYTDGSGLAPGLPEITRCGWGFACLGDNGLPVRGACGPLEGPLQTVGRAERAALFCALKLLRDVELV
eukprot:7234701-Pyramimonas_sp.AAC.1